MAGAVLRDLSGRAVTAGITAGLVGYASTVAVVIAALQAVGGDAATVASGLTAYGIATFLASAGLSIALRMPISIVWSTPGLALVAAGGALPGGLAEALGAFVVAGLLIAATALLRPLQWLVERIPTALASAMLAAVLFKLCLVPFTALATDLRPALALLLLWLFAMRFARLYAGPLVLVAAVLLTLATTTLSLDGAQLWPRLQWVTPVFTLPALLGTAIPLFIVTMASQNIPGAAVLKSFDYRPRLGPIFLTTGALSALSAPFGGVTLNLAALTAAMAASSEAHPDPARRYIAAAAAGLAYLLLAALAGLAALLVTQASPLLIEAAAGLILIPAFGNALNGALAEPDRRLPALVTLLLGVSGTGFFGIGAAFWGLVAGCALLLLQPRARQDGRA